MSLTTYVSATPWAQSMREQLIWERMPPWYADPGGPAVKGGHALTPRELDILITWATGGNPEGEVAKKPAPVPLPPEWWAGKPDFVVAMPASHTVPASTLEESAEFMLATGLSEAKWVKGVDLLPGAPSMVREAVIQVENGPVLGIWVPGHDARAMTPPGGAGFKLPAGAGCTADSLQEKLAGRAEGADRSQQRRSVLHGAAGVGERIQAMTFGGPVTDGLASGAESLDRASEVVGTFKSAVRVLAVRPMLDRPYASLTVRAILPGGRPVPLLLLRNPRQEWPRRYWLADPVELPAGSTLEMIATPMAPNPDEIPTPRRNSFQVALDYIAM